MKKTYEDWSKEKLIERIKELEEGIENSEKRFLVEFPWAGNLGQWNWDYAHNKVQFNDKKVEQLGYDPKSVGEIGFEFFTEKLHPEDYDRVMDNMREHLQGKRDAYEVEYRIKHKDGKYLWYYDRGTITKRDEQGKPLYVQGIVFDITESKNIEDKLVDMAEKDELTGLYNRRMLFQTLDKLKSEHQRNGQEFSLIMFDIDHFKKINDEHGHLTGDKVLEELASVVLEDKRESDSVYRYGGEEFFIVLPKTKKESALKVARRLHKKIQHLEIDPVDQITVSMGVVSFEVGEEVDDVIHRADDLMYEAKQSGRNRIKY